MTTIEKRDYSTVPEAIGCSNDGDPITAASKEIKRIEATAIKKYLMFFLMFSFFRDSLSFCSSKYVFQLFICTFSS